MSIKSIMIKSLYLASAFTCVIGLTLSTPASANDKMTQELIDRISSSKVALMKVELDINQKTTGLARDIDKQQNEVKALRQKAAVLQRFADEQLMSVDQLEKRVTLWSTQSNYQKQLLTSFAESSQLPVDTLKQVDGQPVVDIQALSLMSTQLLERLTPRWQEKQVISEAGTIEAVNTLSLGPIEVAYDASALTGGPISREVSSEPRVLANIFDEKSIEELGSIKASGAGLLRFDPTLGNAYKLLDKEEGILAHVEKGGVWALPIVFFAFLSLIVSTLKGVQLIRLPKIDRLLIDKIKALVHVESTGDSEEAHRIKEEVLLLSARANGAQRKLLDIAMHTPVSQERDDLLVAYLIEYKYKIERFIGAIATSAAIAPLLGLLGTVSGMISTFMMMTIFGTGDASTVSGGISEALITTELGLIVAIPSLIISALLSRRTKSYASKLEANAIKLSKLNFA
jgi:biopolymer transport protein ExbB